MTEPTEVTLQHILIQQSADAKERALSLLDRAQKGEDFETLVKEHSEDPGGGTYRLLNHGSEERTFSDVISDLNGRAAERDAFFREQVSSGQMPPEQAEKEMGAFVEELQKESAACQDLPYPRATMVKSFGDIGFGLGVGEIGMAEHHEEDSPFGWHIIMRTA